MDPQQNFQPSQEAPEEPIKEVVKESGEQPIQAQVETPPTATAPSLDLDVTPQDPAMPVTPVVPSAFEAAPNVSPETPRFFTGTGAETNTPIVMQPKKARGKWFIPLVVLAVVVILGGSAAAYFGYFVPRQPQNVLPKAIANTLSEGKIKTTHLLGSFTLKMADVPVNFTGNLNAALDGKGYDATLSLNASSTNLTAHVISTDNKTIYLKLGGLDAVPAILQSFGGDMAQYAPIVQALNNQWVNFPPITQSSSSSIQISDADAQKIGDAYRHHMFLEVPKTYANEKVNGVDSYHYQVKINQTTLAAFLQDVQNLKLKSMPLTSKDISSMKSANLGAHPFDVWIASSSLIIDKFAYDGTTDFNNSAGTTNYHVELSLADVNAPVSITKPTTSKPFQDVVTGATKGDSSPIQKLLTGGNTLGLNAQSL